MLRESVWLMSVYVCVSAFFYMCVWSFIVSVYMFLHMYMCVCVCVVMCVCMCMHEHVSQQNPKHYLCVHMHVCGRGCG